MTISSDWSSCHYLIAKAHTIFSEQKRDVFFFVTNRLGENMNKRPRPINIIVAQPVKI